MSRPYPLLFWLGLSAVVHALVALPHGQHSRALPVQQERILAVDFADRPAMRPSTAHRGHASAAHSRPLRRSSAAVEAHARREQHPHATAPAGTQQRSGQVARTAEAQEQQEQAQVEARLRTHLAQHFVYPELARRRGWEGEVVLRLRIVPPGTIEHVQVARSSGYDVIDRAAMRALGRAELSGAAVLSQSFEMQLPIIYRLRGG